MKHVLDNPAWHALISGNIHLANGNEHVKYFDREVSPFAALKINSPENFARLFKMLPYNGPILFITPEEMDFPVQWQVVRLIKGLQMIFDMEKKPDDVLHRIIPLTFKHIPQMLALTKLTDPGPFGERTIEFGHYYGIFEGDKLVSMAGQRLNLLKYVEISAVCTHPEHTGNGYARQLLLQQLHRIKKTSGIPFLHVRNDNERAIKVYENLGFSTRKEIFFYALRRVND